MPSARDLLAAEERYEALSDAQKRAVIKCQAKMRGWAQRHKSRARLLRESTAKGGVWAQFSLPPSETLVETYRAHLGGPIASGTGDLSITSGHVCFYCESATDTSQRDGVLFSPVKKKRGPNAPKPISLKIAYREIASVGVKGEWSESGVTLSMRDGSAIWFGGFYFASSVKALIEAEWRRETVTKMEEARSLRAAMVAAMAKKREETAKSARDDALRALETRLEAEREKTRRAEARERDQIVEIEVLRENEERIERQKKKLAVTAREFEEECEMLRKKTAAANAARRAAEKKLDDAESTFETKIDRLLGEKNMTINELSDEVNKFKEMWREDKAQMKAELEKARGQTSELRNQRDVLVSEKSKLVIEVGRLESDLTKFSKSSAHDSRRVCELEAELQEFHSGRAVAAEELKTTKLRYNEAMKQIAVLEAAKHAHVASNVSEIELNAKISEIDSLKANVESLRARLSKKVDDCAALRAKYDDVAKELDETRASREEMTRSNDRERAQELAALESKVAALQKALQDKTTETERAQSQISALRSSESKSSADFEAKMMCMEEELREKSTEIDALRDALANKTSESERASSQISTLRSEAKSSADFEAKIASLEEKLHHKSTEISALRKALESKTAESERASSQLSALQSEAKSSADLEAATANLRRELQHKSTEIHVLRNALETKKAEIERAVNEITALRASEAEVSADFKAKMAELQEALENKATKTEALQSELAALHVTRETSAAVSTTLKAKYDEAKRQISALHAAETQLRVDLEAKITELSSTLADKSAKTDALQSELVDVRKARDTSAIAIATLEVKYEESLKQITSLHAQLDKASTSNSAESQRREQALREELDGKSAACERLREEMDQHRVERENAAVATATLRSKFEEVSAKLEDVKAQRDADASRFASERVELERALVEAKETSAAALSAVQTERESMRDAKEKSTVSLVSLKAKLEEATKQLVASKGELEKASTAREEALEKMHAALRGEESTKTSIVAMEKTLVERDAEMKSMRMEITAFSAAAKSADERERLARAELQELRLQNEALVKEHGALEGRSKMLDERAIHLAEVEKQCAALKAELTVTAIQHEKWQQDVEYAKSEIERTRSKEAENNEKYMDMLKNMSDAEREAASARAAESVARDYAARSNETVKETREREVRMRDELATMRVAYETLSTEFRVKTEEFAREVARLEKAVSDEEGKVKVLQVKLDESVEKISNLEQLNIEATNKLVTCEDTLRRQKDESRQIYIEYQKTHAELTELSRQLEREQEQTVDMHLQKALEKQRSSSAVRHGFLPGARGGGFPVARTPLGDVNTGGSPVGASIRAIAGVPPITEMLPSLAKVNPPPAKLMAIAAAPASEAR